MPAAVRRPLVVVPLCSLLLGGAGGLLADAGSDARGPEIFRHVPPPDVRSARAAVPTPHPRVQARPPARWLGGTMGPAAAPAPATLPDFGRIRDVRARKERFFAFLLPLVHEENRRLGELRQRLGFIREHQRWHRRLAEDDRAWLAAVAAEFRLTHLPLEADAFWEQLLRRVDALPEELVLVQAANESAWGTSRFAREGNNLFGQWCFREGCGIVPAARPAGANHEVARFRSVRESVGSYMRNLNTGRSYRELRAIRARLRAAGRAPAGHDLAAGLVHYSERGTAYVDEIRAMLRHNASVIAEVRDRAMLSSS